MKSISASFHHEIHDRAKSGYRAIPVVVTPTREILALSGAAVAAVAVVLLSVWAAGWMTTGILAAISWGLGFVFLALAIDSRQKLAVLHVTTGILLFPLAWLQGNVSPDFVIASAIILATWSGAVTFRHLR